MSEPNIKRNFIYRLLYEVLVLITPFITLPYISRVLGADGIGIHSYATSIITYFTLAATLGTTTYGTREIARNREDKKAYSKLFWEIELLTVMTTIVCLVGWGIFVSVVKQYQMVFFALTPSLIAIMFDISWLYNGHEKIIYSIIWNSACKIAGIVLLFLFVKQKSDLIIYTIINSGTVMLGNMSMWIFLPKFLVRVDFRKLTFKRHFKETLTYFIPAVATTIYTVLDKTLIQLITKDEFQNGYYEQATRINNMVKIIVFASVNAVMGARISYLFAKEKYDEIRVRIGRSMDFILLVGYGCAFGVVGIAGNFVPAFFGEGYGPVVPLLYVMIVLVIIIGVSNCLETQYFTPSGRRRDSTKYIIIGSLVNLTLNLAIIPFLGAVGAVIASIIAELCITILYLKNSTKFFNAKSLIEYSWKRIIAGAVMCAIMILIGNININIVVLIIVQFCAGIIIYIAILLLMKDKMTKELLLIVKNIISKAAGKIKRT